jgi:hypothetical protein
MPNWCEGTLKVRGTIKDLKNFVLNGLIPVNPLGATKEPLSLDGEDETSLYISSVPDTLYIKGTRRAFCEPDYIEVDSDEPNDKTILTMPFKQAWAILSDNLLEVCKEFNIDMKIQGFERGMRFSQIVEIVDGEIIQDEEIKYDDWEWDCPCPDMGG